MCSPCKFSDHPNKQAMRKTVALPWADHNQVAMWQHIRRHLCSGIFSDDVNICVCGLQAHLEVQAAWDCMQKELQRLVTELLGTSASASHSASGNRVVLTK